MPEETKICYLCGGSGSRTEYVTEIDMGTSVAMGLAMGTGYFPMTHTVPRTVTCYTCHGTGRVRS
jgi:DnaJ-class molecular chaperone